MRINYFNADETADKPYLIRLSGKTKLIGLLALSLMIISILVIVLTNQYGPKAMDNIRLNGNIVFRINQFECSIVFYSLQQKFVNLYYFFLPSE